MLCTFGAEVGCNAVVLGADRVVQWRATPSVDGRGGRAEFLNETANDVQDPLRCCQMECRTLIIVAAADVDLRLLCERAQACKVATGRSIAKVTRRPAPTPGGLQSRSAPEEAVLDGLNGGPPHPIVRPIGR